MDSGVGNAGTTGARVEAMIAEISALGDPRAQQLAEDVVRELVGLYGAALERMVAALDADEAGHALLRVVADDDLVGSLLVLHDLHPLDTLERVQVALDTVRPYLGSHAGGVEVLGLGESPDGPVLRLRLEGSCDGCPSSALTVKLAIEGAVLKVAPELVGVEVDGVIPEPVYEPGDRRSLSLTPVGRAGAPAAASQQVTPMDVSAQWIDLPSASIPEGMVRRLDTLGGSIVLCAAAGATYAFRDACGRCGRSLADSTLAGVLLRCAGCVQEYDVSRAGVAPEASAQVHLDALPVVPGDGGLRVAVAVAVPA